MKVYLNKRNGQRRVVNVELIQKRKHSVLVRLPDGNIIVRKWRDVVNAQQFKN